MMATTKSDSSPRLERLVDESNGLTGFDKALMDDLLEEYDALSTMVDRLRDVILEKGPMTVKMVGQHNPREDTVERPEFTSYQKAVKTKSDLAKKMSDFAKRSDDEGKEEERDDLVGWNRAR
jgi:hypothetical protein